MKEESGTIRLDAEQFERSGFLREGGDALVRGDAYVREILDLLPTAVYVTDADGLITYFNDAAAALWGDRPDPNTGAWRGSWKLFWPDGRPMPYDESPMVVALKQGRPVRGVETIAEREDGSRIAFLPYPTPLYDASGNPVGAVNMLVDVTDRRQAEEYEQRLASIVEWSDDAIVSKDLNGIITSWNKGAERLFGYSAEEVVGKPITILIPPDRLKEEDEIIGRIRGGDHIDHYETVRRRKDGSPLEVSLTVSPLKNSDGRIIGASKIARNITEQKRAQEKQNLLISEIKHRIKNTLATVQVIANQTFRSAPDNEREAFFARLNALAGAQDLLTHDNWHRAPVSEIVGRALKAFREKHRKRFLLEGAEGIWLDAQKSALLSIALHELATNAVKYGALSSEGGRVQVAWDLLGADERKRLQLCWRECGGPPVEPPGEKGFGSLLIERALAIGDGSGNLDFAPQGLVCTLEISL